MARAAVSETPVHERPAELLQKLIRFDTTNPPGNERDCIAYIDGLLTEAGCETTIRARDPDRPNLVARVPGRGAAPPLLLYGHVDVVTTEGQQWTHPPFEGTIADGYVWGRGALDMKSGVAMLLSAVLRARAEGLEPAGDVLFCALSDEEAFGGYGARFMVESHADLFAGARFALGEFGGFSLYLAGKRFYPIEVTEKEICSLRVTVRGPGGHGALPIKGGATAKLGRVLRKLDGSRLPFHLTPVVRDMCEAIGRALGRPGTLVLAALTNPRLADPLLTLLGDRGRTLDPLLHNTVTPTIVHASEKVNVIPSEASVVCDGRILPGFTPTDLVAEVAALLGDGVEIEVVHHDPGPAVPDMALFGTLAGVLRDMDPEGTPIPLLMAGVSDARFFSRIGIQTYGYLPMQLPAGFNFWETIHGADERIPVEAVGFGAEAVYRAITRYGPVDG